MQLSFYFHRRVSPKIRTARTDVLFIKSSKTPSKRYHAQNGLTFCFLNPPKLIPNGIVFTILMAFCSLPEWLTPFVDTFYHSVSAYLKFHEISFRWEVCSNFPLESRSAHAPAAITSRLRMPRGTRLTPFGVPLPPIGNSKYHSGVESTVSRT